MSNSQVSWDNLLKIPFTWENRHRILDYLSYKGKVRFALFCAEQVSHLSNNKSAEKAIEFTKLWLVDKATDSECWGADAAADAAATAAACAAATACAADAACAAATAAAAYAATATAAACAADAAYATAAADIKDKQLQYLRALIIEELPADLKSNWLVVASL